MTVDLTPETVETARQRDGAPDPDRPERVDEILERETLGYREGKPLVDVRKGGYGAYPEREELADPKWGTFVRELMAHPLVSGYDDCVAESQGATDTVSQRRWRESLQEAARAFDLDVVDLFEQGSDEQDQGREGRLADVLGYEPPSEVVGPRNSILVGELYTLGCGVTEIVDLLEDHCENVREDHVTDALKGVSLLEGRTRDEQKEAFDDRGRLSVGGDSIPMDTGSENISIS